MNNDSLNTPTLTPTPEPTPTQPPTPTPDQPIPAPEPAPASTPAPVSEPTPIPTPTPEQSTPVSAPTPEPEPKKKRTGLIIAILAFLILIGGIIFATLVIIKNTPENIFLDSMNNLGNAKQVAINGDIKFTPKNLGLVGIESINFNLDTKLVEFNHHTEANIQINFVDGNSTNLINFGEVMLENGVFYLHVDGINELYQDYIRETISSSSENFIKTHSNYDKNANCYGLYHYEGNTLVESCLSGEEITQKVNETLTEIDNIITEIDGQWFEVSIENILNSKFITEKLKIPEISKQSIISYFNCTVGTFNRLPDYSEEFSNLYNQYSFIRLSPGQDDYYNVSFDAKNLTKYINNLAKVSFFSDVAKCTNGSVPESYNGEIAENLIENSPDLSLRFEGLLSHHLKDVKISKTNDYFDITANFNITYPSNLQISVPSNSKPIIEPVEEIYNAVIHFLYQ